MLPANNRQFVVFGNSLAASMTMSALSKDLPDSVELIWLKPAISSPSDILFGGISSPDAYHFNLQHGVSEPELILNTDTTFSFGSRFAKWGNNKRAWMQCFHLPFAATSGVELHHFMTKHNATLEDFLISAQAALKGAFAHPPSDNPQSALSRAEYGYHFDPQQWSTVFANKIDQQRVKVIRSDIAAVQSKNDGIEYLKLIDGTSLQAELFIDCSGANSQIFASLPNHFEVQRRVQLSSQSQVSPKTGPAYRLINGNEQGWQSVTPLRKNNMLLSLTEKNSHDSQIDSQTFALGYHTIAWQGNCVAIGHSAYSLEPLTPASYMLLIKDITRLLELIPINQTCQTERQEYNRRYQNDVKHAELFHRALYAEQRDVGYGVCEKLDRKLSQYLHRGILASYDFEPFNQQDWAILHAGLGRKPQSYCAMAEQVEFDQMTANLQAMRAGIKRLAASMPPHHLYLEKLSMYLKESKKNGY